MDTLVEQALDLLKAYIEDRHDGNCAAAARDLNLHPATLNQWLNGIKAPTLKALSPVFARLGISFQSVKKELFSYDWLPVLHREVGGGFGPGGLDHVDRKMPVDPEFLKSAGLDPQNTVIVGIRSKAMEPVFSPGDLLLVDLGDTELQEGRHYLIELHDQWIVRLIALSVTGLVLIASSPNYERSLPVTEDQMKDLKVLGRVAWCLKKM